VSLADDVNSVGLSAHKTDVQPNGVALPSRRELSIVSDHDHATICRIHRDFIVCGGHSTGKTNL
jgi:hypothetical protein